MTMRITAQTRLIGLFGNPVGHSISPVFMNHALERLGLNHIYGAFLIPRKEIGPAVHSVRILGFRGVNITIPFKEEVIPHLQSIDEDACSIGAVNCIVNENGTLVGYNTDHRGFIHPLIDRGIRVAGKKALVIGSGGAARAVLYALIHAEMGEIAILNRTRKNAETLVRWCRDELGFSSIEYIGTREDGCRKAAQYDLIVNTTPVGMSPDAEQSPLPGDFAFHSRQTVYDLVYNPPETKLLRQAKKCNATTINGFEMLILQGLYSLILWFPQHENDIMSLKRQVVEFMQGRPGDNDAER
jgi:shikimate dehydrogenase